MKKEEIVLKCLQNNGSCDKCPYENDERKCHHIIDIVHAIRHPFWYEVRRKPLIRDFKY